MDLIQSEIDRQISSGMLKPGERLATERELAAKFGVSRAIARAAILELVEAGKVNRHVGRGSFVTDATGQNETLGIRYDLSPAEIMEFRMLIEPSLVDLILLNANSSELQAIAGCVEEAEHSTDRMQWNRYDDQFHLLLAKATHNRIVISLYETFSLARKSAAWIRMKEQSAGPNTWRSFQAEHRLISGAILAGDRDAASRAMRQHIMRARALMMGYEMPSST